MSTQIPELKQFDPFVGEWKTEGEIIAPEGSSSILVKGTDTYEWLPGGYFLIHQVDVCMGDEQICSTETIRYDPSTGKFPMHFFGHQGSAGVMYASLDDNIWKFVGETERFTGSLNKSGDFISGKWERLHNNKWLDWMKITLTRVAK